MTIRYHLIPLLQAKQVTKIVMRVAERVVHRVRRNLRLRVSPRTVREYMPSDCVVSPGRRCQSQRWSTVIRNPSKGLVISGFRTEAARKSQAGFVLIRWLIQRCFDRTAGRTSTPTPPVSQLAFVFRDEFHEVSNFTPLRRAEDGRCVERNPPEQRSSRNPDSFPALPVARVEIRSVIDIGCCQTPVRGQTLSIRSDLNSAIRSESLSRAV